jgi:hypothetical protein
VTDDRFSAAPGDPDRWGVYLRPDPRTCAAVSTVTGQLNAQYGLVSAGAFPPHATLIGSQHVVAPAAEIVATLDAALAGKTAIEVHNAGIVPMDQGYVYDLHHLADATTPNAEILTLGEAVDAALAPLVSPAPNPGPHDFDRDRYRAHLSLASHDLYQWPHLHDEVGEYLRALPVDPPDTFSGDTVALYRTASADWSGRWWRTLTWEHVHSWRLPSRVS